MLYCTLAEAKAEIKATSTTDDNGVLRYIRQVSRKVDLLMWKTRRPFFGPWSEAHKVLIWGRTVNSGLNTLMLDRPLLSFSAVLADTTAVTSVAEGYPQGFPPYWQLRITSSGDYWWNYGCNSCDPIYATITGVWGYHSDWDNAWMAVDALAAGINASVTSLTVADADGADDYGLTPRISAGNLLKLGDEYLEVTATNTTTNVVTVRRGVNGTTAAVHSLGDAVYIFQVEDPIRRIARQAAMWYARRGAFEVSVSDGVGQTTYPQGWLQELSETLTEYQYV